MTLIRWWAAAGLGATVLVLASLPLGLNGDVQYVLGGLRVHDSADPLRFIDTFTHRPIAYRAILSGLTDLLGLVRIGPEAMQTFEASFRLVAVLLAIGAGAALWAGLRARLGAAEAVAAGASVALVLALAPNFDFLQPEWFAGVFLALGVSAGLGLRNELAAALLAGALLTLAVAVKLATAPLAIAGVLSIGLLDRRRAMLTTLAGMLCGAGWVLLVRATPHEWRWMKEMASLNPHSPLRDTLGLMEAVNAFKVLGAKLAVTPILVMVPAALVVIGRTLEGRSRWAVPVLLLAVMGLSFAPLVAQAQWGLYHLAHLPVVGAGIVAVAVVRWWRLSGRPPLLLLLPLAGLAAWSVIALSLPLEWRDANGVGVMLGLMLAGVLLTIGPFVLSDMRSPVRGRPIGDHGGARSAWLAVALAGAALAVAPALVPPAAWSLDSAHTPYTNAGWAQRAASTRSALEELRGRIPADARVLYLAYGDVAYHVGSPTGCRYPSPLWIQRAAFFGYVRYFDSYRENLHCVSDGGEPFALLQPGWLRPTRIPAPAEALIETTFDCSAALDAGEVLLCPRR